MFQLIEHRRLMSFGLVHGLVRRVHNFPIVANANFTENERKVIAASMESSEQLHSIPAVVYRDRSASREGRGHPHHHHHHRVSSHHSQQLHHSQQPMSKESQQKMALMLAYMMDGRHCDDELVCRFEKPLPELFEMVADRHIVHTYAPGTSY